MYLEEVGELWMEKIKYRLSFTAGSLLMNETISVAKIYLQNQDWKLTREIAISENITNSRTTNAARRFVSEIIIRLSSLSQEEIRNIVDEDNASAKKQLVWIALCKTYKYIADFMEEVVINKISKMDYLLETKDYDRFYHVKSQWHDELEKITDTTKYKLKQVLFKMLNQMDFINESGSIVEISIMGSVKNYYANEYDMIKHWFTAI